jgi:hypothetical protein
MHKVGRGGGEEGGGKEELTHHSEKARSPVDCSFPPCSARRRLETPLLARCGLVCIAWVMS